MKKENLFMKWLGTIGLVILVVATFHSSMRESEDYVNPSAYDCGSFTSWAKAQSFFESHDPINDPYHLDRNGNAIACEDYKY